MHAGSQQSDAAASLRQRIGDAFDRVADRYDDHAALEEEVGRRLLERCEYCRRLPERIFDLGCGTGVAAEALKRRYRRARVIGLDLAPAMLARLRRRSSLLRPLSGVCGDIAALPFARATADLLFANLVHHWAPDSSAVFDEYRRVLRPEGLLLFSTFGPGTLREVRQAGATGGADLTLPEFPDLLEIGDALVASGFSEPVMDTETITLQYPRVDAMLRELEATGTALLVGGWHRWAAGGSGLEAAWEPLCSGGRYPLSYEIVYGTAYGPGEGQPRRTAGGEVATFSVDSLLKSRRVR